MRALMLGGVLLSLTASAATTITVPLTVTVTPTTVTVVVGGSTTMIPVPSAPPVCGPSPPTTVTTQACPAGTTGTWQQTTTYTAAPAPLCWVPALTPAAAPPGACTPITPPPVTANCGNQMGGTVIFCDTFDAPSATPGLRAAGLGNWWGVSRTMGAGVNFGQQQYGMWAQTQLVTCTGTVTVNPPNDVTVCGGQLREGSNDNVQLCFDCGDVTSLAMYPKQPFDFAGRTGTVSFDVSNDTAGSHSAWPEFWMSDLPVPDPFNHFDSWQALPANGFGVRMEANCDPGQQCVCPNGNNLNTNRWTVGSAVVVRNYVYGDSGGFGTAAPTVTQMDCVIASTGPGVMNHVELRIAQNEIDVYASDAGKTALRLIAKITNANLTLTRGLIWLEDVHYNADKGDTTRPSQRQHTFAWDNVSFDGPFTYRDFAFDAPDANTPLFNGATSLGKLSAPNGVSTWAVPGIPANPQATAARVLFSFNSEQGANPTSLNVIVNGHAHSVPWPYPDNSNTDWKTFAVTVPLTDLVAGTNTVLLGSNVQEVFANVDIVLVNVTGGVPVLPGSNNKFPGT